MAGLLERIEWVLANRPVASRRAWSLAAGRSHAQVNMMIHRLKADPNQSFDSEVMADLARAAGVRFEWLARGVGSPEEKAETAAERAAIAFVALADDPDEARAFLAQRAARMSTHHEGLSAHDHLGALRVQFADWLTRGGAKEAIPAGAIDRAPGQDLPIMRTKKKASGERR